MQQAGIDQTVRAVAEFDPPVISLGEHVTYRVVVTAMIEGVSLPDRLPTPPGLDLAYASRGFSFGGGGLGVQPRTTLSYRVGVNGPGTYLVPAFNGSANGKPVTIPGARLQVLPAGTPVPGLRPPRLLVEVPPGACYIGQAVRVGVTLVDPGDNSVIGLAQPQVGGDAFVAELGPVGFRRELRQEGGRTVVAFRYEMLVTPVREGRLSLTAHGQAVLNRLPSARGAAPFPNVSPWMDSEPVELTVEHLPQTGELPGFTGGIGSFQLDLPPALDQSGPRRRTRDAHRHGERRRQSEPAGPAQIRGRPGLASVSGGGR